MENPTPKFDLEKNQQDLKLYFFTVQTGAIKIDLPEDVQAIVAYNDEEAFQELRRHYVRGVPMLVKKRASVSYKKILTVLKEPTLGSPMTMPQETATTPEPAPAVTVTATTPEQFIHNLLLVADKFVTEKRDQTTLKRIISKIKINEDQTAPTPQTNLA